MARYRLGIATALWGRPAMTRAFLRYWRGLDVPGVDLVRVAASSPEDPEQRKRAAGWRIVEAPNSPLSNKFNRAVLELAGRVDGVMIVGSDDFACARYVAGAVGAARAGAWWVQPAHIDVYDLATCRAKRVPGPRIGPGRLLSASLLDLCRWRPYPSDNDYVNGNMGWRLMHLRKRLKRSGSGAWEHIKALEMTLPGHLVDVKNGAGKWGYDDLSGGSPVPERERLELFIKSLTI